MCCLFTFLGESGVSALCQTPCVASCQTNTFIDINILPVVDKENKMLRKEVYDVREKIIGMAGESKKCVLTEATFRNDRTS